MSTSKQPIAIGSMRRRIVIEAPQRSDDGVGGAELTWTHLATVWAYVAAGDGREWVNRDVLATDDIYTVHIRHRTDITADMRLRLGLRVLSIRSVADASGPPRWLRILAVDERR